MCQVVTAEFEDEIGFIGVKGDLPRGHWQGLYLKARQVQVDQLANALDGADLEMRR